MALLNPRSNPMIDNDRICKLFIVYDSDRNPFRSLISLGLKDPVLLKAILALAARHNANTGHSFYQHDEHKSPIFIHANRDAFLFKHQAMEALSRALSGSTVDIQDTKVASIFLLIFLDLLESGSDGWNFHLEGAKSLIASHRLLPDAQPGINQGVGQTINEIRDFITKQIHLYVPACVIEVTHEAEYPRLITIAPGSKLSGQPFYVRNCYPNLHPPKTSSSRKQLKSRSWDVRNIS